MKKSTVAFVATITLLVATNAATLYFWIDTSVTLMYMQDSFRSAEKALQQAVPVLREHAVGKSRVELVTEWRKHGVTMDSIFTKSPEQEGQLVIIDNFVYRYDKQGRFASFEFSNSYFNQNIQAEIQE